MLQLPSPLRPVHRAAPDALPRCLKSLHTSISIAFEKNLEAPPAHNSAHTPDGSCRFFISLITSKSSIVAFPSSPSPVYLTSYRPCRFDGRVTPSFFTI